MPVREGHKAYTNFQMFSPFPILSINPQCSNPTTHLQQIYIYIYIYLFFLYMPPTPTISTWTILRSSSLRRPIFRQRTPKPSLANPWQCGTFFFFNLLFFLQRLQGGICFTMVFLQLHHLQISTFSKGHLPSRVAEMGIPSVDRGHKKKLYLVREKL
jgi:hypothetical protein